MQTSRFLLCLVSIGCVSNPPGGAGSTGGGGGSGGVVSAELPCEVATVLQGTCQSCHGTSLKNGAPMKLQTRADLLTPSNIAPQMSYGQRSVLRMRAAAPGTMPPSPLSPIATDAIDAFEGWVTSGMPPGSCGMGGAGGGSGSTGGGAGGGGATIPFVPDTPATYVAKVKQVLVGLPPTDAELTAVAADPAQLAVLVDGWMALPQYPTKLQRFFQLAFQQTQVTFLNFTEMLLNAQLPLNQSPELVQNLQESFARTMLALNAQNKPFTQAMTTRQYSMTTALQTFYAVRDVWQIDNDPRTVHDTWRQQNPTLNVTVVGTGTPIPLAQSIDPTHANYMKFYDPSVATVCGSDPYVTPATANTVYEVLIGGKPNVCNGPGSLVGQLTAADYADWKLVTIRAPRAGEKATRFFDAPLMRSSAQTELVLARPYVGFFTTPAFLANWSTNDSNQMRVTLNQALIVATGMQVDGTDTMTPTSTPGLDSVHANDASCVYCHQTLDPSRSIFSATYSWNYGSQTDPAFSGQKGRFAFRGVEAPMNSIFDLGDTLAAHPLFATAWTQKLCYWVNSQECDVADPEFLRIAALFKSSSYAWNTLVKELVTSPLVTHASSTLTATTAGVAVAVTRRDHLCAMWNARLGFKDVCGMDVTVGSPLQATGRQIIPGLPCDGYSRGGTAPVLPNAPSLFYRAGLENLCLNVAALVVDATTPLPGVKQWSSTQPTAAIAEFVSLVAGLPASDPRAAGVLAALTQHFDDAKATAGITPTLALRSTFGVACMSPTAAAIGL